MLHHLLSIEQINERFSPLINERTGIIKHLYELQRLGGYPDFTVYAAEMGRFDALVRPTQWQGGKVSYSGAFHGAGSSTNRELARTKALCEALERYCTVLSDYSQVIVATPDELGDAAINLDAFVQGAPEEYAPDYPLNRLTPFSRHKPLRWYPAVSLTHGRRIYVPFMHVYLDGVNEYTGETSILPISTGAAIAGSYEQAIITGLLEVIERDALTITWLQQLPLPRILVESIDDARFREYYARTRACGIEQYFFDATFDLGIPTIYALQVKPQARVAAIVMAATKLDPLSALVRVIEEAAATRLGISNWTERPPAFDIDDFSTFTRLEDGAVYYADPLRLSAFDFLLNHSNTRHLQAMSNVDQGDVESNLKTLIEMGRQHNLDILVADITTDIARDLGMYAVKVIVPQLLPLTVNHNLRYTAAARLYDVPKKLGYPVRNREHLNPNPQPFA